jgi:hypothetical protein
MKSAALLSVSTPLPHKPPVFLKIESFAAGAVAREPSGQTPNPPLPKASLSMIEADPHEVMPVVEFTRKRLPVDPRLNVRLRSGGTLPS